MTRRTSNAPPSTNRKRLTHAAMPLPDTELLLLGQAFGSAQARVDAAEAELACGRMSEAEFERLCREMFDIRDAIQAVRACTADGLGVKARIAARYLEDPGSWQYAFENITGSLVADILCLTAGRRPEAVCAIMRGHSMAGQS